MSLLELKKLHESFVETSETFFMHGTNWKIKHFFSGGEHNFFSLYGLNVCFCNVNFDHKRLKCTTIPCFTKNENYQCSSRQINFFLSLRLCNMTVMSFREELSVEVKNSVVLKSNTFPLVPNWREFGGITVKIRLRKWITRKQFQTSVIYTCFIHSISWGLLYCRILIVYVGNINVCVTLVK